MRLIGLVVLVVVGSIVAAIVIPAHNRQVANDATATAQVEANATGTVRAQITATAAYVATATVAAASYPFSARLQLNDSLSGNTGKIWESSRNCVFTDGSYHVFEETTNAYYSCMAQETGFSNFTYEVTVRLLKGEGAGLVFRSDKTSGKAYKFVVAVDGSVALLIYKDYGTGKNLFTGQVSGIQKDQETRVGVVVRGSELALYINGKLVGRATDSSYSSGQIGVVVYNTDQPVEAIFSNAKVWAL
jgi:hypothetical protein